MPSPVQLVRRLLSDERFRFLLVGGVNTVVGYGLFVVFELSIGKHIAVGYLVSLYLSWALASILAFFLHRRFTFRIAGRQHLVRDFFRFVGVSLVALAVNSVALPLLVEVAHLVPIFAQALIVVVTTTISYLGHKFFSFRRAPRVDENAQP
jgi:putative flippase GtrA